MKNLILFLFLIAFQAGCKSGGIFSSSTNLGSTKNNVSQNYHRIMFYNCENLYDYLNDSLKNDEEYLPDGLRHWTKYRYYDKLNRVARVITAVGEWQPPTIIGLCEIENRMVLDDLTEHSILRKLDYQIIHAESPDIRGIDVAFLYNAKVFYPLYYRAIPVAYPNNPTRKTRDILYVKGILSRVDTIHFFVNHWPSRFGGQVESEENRLYVASIIKEQTDSIFLTNRNSNILIMGDLNDYPTDKSLLEVLQTQTDFSTIKDGKLYNLSYYLQEEKKVWSHKFQGHGGVLDQIIVSSSLLKSDNKLFTSVQYAKIGDIPFLLEADEQYSGVKPFRAFVGFKYNGGYSDHLPVFLDLFY